MYRYVLSYVSCLSCTFIWSSNYALLYMVIYSLMHATSYALCIHSLCTWVIIASYPFINYACWPSCCSLELMQALMHLYALQCGRHLMRPRGHVPLMHLTFYVVTVLCTPMHPLRYAATHAYEIMQVYADVYLCVHAVMLSYAMCDELCNVMLRLWIAFLMRTYVLKCMSCTLMQLGSYALFALCMSCSLYVSLRCTCCYT